MIIFDLDNTLSDASHRQHFVDPSKNSDYEAVFPHIMEFHALIKPKWLNKKTGEKFIPDWKSFYEACDKDTPIKPVIHTLEYLGEALEYGRDCPYIDYDGIEIWSGRCESVRKKTEKWLQKHIRHYEIGFPFLKMRPIGDSIPDDQLKEKWLDEAISQGKTIEYVFDDRKKVIEMWKRRGIFVFDVSQGEGDF